jgi:hypothetical protein
MRTQRRAQAHHDIAPIEPHRALAPEPRHIASELLGSVAQNVVAVLGFHEQCCGENRPRRRALIGGLRWRRGRQDYDEIVRVRIMLLCPRCTRPRGSSSTGSSCCGISY